MIENLTPADVQRNAIRVAESVRAYVFHLAELIEHYNSEEDSQIDPVGVLSTAQIKFVKPTGGMINGLMGQFNVVLVQVVPVEPTHTIGHVMEQGYHVVPISELPMWKQIILEAHAEAINSVIEDIYAEDEEGAEGEGYEGAPAQPQVEAATDFVVPGDNTPSEGNEEV